MPFGGLVEATSAVGRLGAGSFIEGGMFALRGAAMQRRPATATTCRRRSKPPLWHEASYVEALRARAVFVGGETGSMRFRPKQLNFLCAFSWQSIAVFGSALAPSATERRHRDRACPRLGDRRRKAARARTVGVARAG